MEYHRLGCAAAFGRGPRGAAGRWIKQYLYSAQYVREPRALTSRSFVSGYFIYIYIGSGEGSAPRAHGARGRRGRVRSARAQGASTVNAPRSSVAPTRTVHTHTFRCGCVTHTHNGTHGTHAHEHGTCLYRMILLARTREARWSGTRPSPAAPSGSQEGVAALVEAVRSSASCTAVHAAALASV